MQKSRMNICLVSDFFLPQMGGVEVHIYELAKELHLRGHKVVVVTHRYHNSVGVRWLQPGIKVYYLPHFSFGFNTIMPSYILTLPLAREILLRENIQVTHSHQASSVLAGEFLSHSRLLGIRTVHTEHSLFGFSDIGAINLMKVAEVFHTETDRIICVSRTTRENFHLRTNIPLERLEVVPNGINMQRATESVRKNYPSLISVGRLYYRKGVDLLIDVIPEVVKQHPTLQWKIIGDGPKKYLLQHMVKKHNLSANIHLLGRVQHQVVKELLEDSSIYVNTSLTQSFGIAVLEAASLGLICVTTNVGAVNEIMPQNELILVQPTRGDIIRGIVKSISISQKQIQHRGTKWSSIYNWSHCAQRCEGIYREVISLGKVSFDSRVKYLASKCSFSHLMILLMVLLCKVALMMLDAVRPRHQISIPMRLKA